jgi:hypothetical protein
MSATPDAELADRVRAVLITQGAVLTDAEVSQLLDRYPRAGGSGRWDVRVYAGQRGPGTREYRVVRGDSTRDVYRSSERVHAVLVQGALNEMEAAETHPPRL